MTKSDDAEVAFDGAEGGVEDVGHFVDLRFGDDEGWRVEHVIADDAVDGALTGVRNKTPLEGGIADALASTGFDREGTFGFTIGDQLDTEHEAEAAHVADDRMDRHKLDQLFL